MPYRARGAFSPLGRLIAFSLLLAEPGIAHAQQPTVPATAQPDSAVQGVTVPNNGGDGEAKAQNNNQGSAQPAQSQQAIATAAAQVGVQSTTGDLKAADASTDCDATCQRDKEDLKAQQSMGNAAWAMFCVAVASFVATIIGIILVWRSLIHTRQSTDAAVKAANAAVEANELNRQSTITDQRAWITSKIEIDSGLTFDADGAQMRVLIKNKNVGKTPAFNVSSAIEVTLDDDAEAVLARLSAEIRREPNTRGRLVAPGDDYERPWVVGMEPAEIEWFTSRDEFTVVTALQSHFSAEFIERLNAATVNTISPCIVGTPGVLTQGELNLDVAGGGYAN